MKNIMINQILIIPLTINEPMMYIFYLMFLKLNKYKSYSDLFFIAKDYYAISFVVILLGSILLMLPVSTKDKGKAYELSEKKMKHKFILIMSSSFLRLWAFYIFSFYISIPFPLG